MVALLAFIGALAAIVVGAVVVNRVRGVRAQYLDAWTPDPGEERLLEDPGADFSVVPRLGQAKVMTFARRRRTHAVLTATRLVIAQRALMSRRYMITHVLLLHAGSGEDGAEAAELEHRTGGQFTRGYVVMSTTPDRITVEADGAKAYLRIVPEPTPSATNVEHCRLYSDMAALFLARLAT
jgi:hypothetical protein